MSKTMHFPYVNLVRAEETLATIPQRWAQNVVRFGKKDALISQGQTLSYDELGQKVDGIAELLRKAQVTAGTLVGLHLDRTVEMVAGLLAILKLGGTYVPLDIGFPAERLHYIIADCGLRHVLLHSQNRLSDFKGTLIDLASERVGATPQPSCPPLPGEPDDLAYIMYTSGSTGRPKGVRIHHRAVMNFLQSMAIMPGISSDDVLLSVTTPAFDISVLELFLPLVHGATVVLASRSETKDGARLGQLIDRHRISMMQATPATWRLLLATGWQGSHRLKALCGGEPLSTALAEKLLNCTASLWNMYGPTETTVWSTCHPVTDPALPIAVGHPIANTTAFVLDDKLQPLPPGTTGILYIGGWGVAKNGYTDAGLTQKRFIPDHLSQRPGFDLLYDTGDLAEVDAQGLILLKGRADFQVKIRGHRVELAEIEAAVSQLSGVDEAVTVATEDMTGSKTLVCCYVATKHGPAPLPGELRDELARRLPEYMIPSKFHPLASLPLTASGKIDRQALIKEFADRSASPPDAETFIYHDNQQLLNDILCRFLGLDQIDPRANVFDLGLDSVTAGTVMALFAQKSGLNINMTALYNHPTMNSFLDHMEDHSEAETLFRLHSARSARRPFATSACSHVAIIGMVGRFPQAENVNELWDHLIHGRVTTTPFAKDEDDPAVPRSQRENPHYVRVRGMIRGKEMFDAPFFGIAPHEAEVMDPQQRVFLELAWHALEDAGYAADAYDGLIGVYAAMGNNMYYHYHVSTKPKLITMVGEVIAEVGREKDHIATLVSHKMNLTGPSISLNTACSSTLVAIDAAYQALISHQCDMALAGGIELRTPQMSGQVHEPDGIFAHDGQCRPFCADADGTLFSDSAGIVVLKRLDDAIKERDTIHAVIRGSAVSHDGHNKKSYLAPSVRGQMEVITKAQVSAGVRGDTLSLLEAHGTGTPIGDPMEFTALKAVFEAATTKKNFCALSSVKANLGHPTTAAGVVGVIKVAMCFAHETVPPQVNFRTINPKIDIQNSPFFINTEALPYPAGPTPRRAGVSSFGFCGTNAHVVLEEPPPPMVAAPPPRPPASLLLVAAKTATALGAHSENLLQFIADRPDADLYDVSYTLACGRARFDHRRFMVIPAHSPQGTRQLFDQNPSLVKSRHLPATRYDLVFLCPGQGSQYVGMGRDLYRHEPVFRAALDTCAALFEGHLAEDIRTVMMPKPGDEAAAAARLMDTYYAQPSIFCLEYCIGTLLLHWGFTPSALIGHSVGEFVCATFAGVFSLTDAVKLVATRSKLMRQLPRGGMLSVRAPHQDVAPLLCEELAVAAINSPDLCVVAGPDGALDRLGKTLAAQNVAVRRLNTSHAFHSAMMEPAIAPFLEVVRAIPLSAPRLPIISTVTGALIGADRLCDPLYWARHLRQPVQFADALASLAGRPKPSILVEIGPRATLSSLAMSVAGAGGKVMAVPTTSDNANDNAEYIAMLQAVGTLWLAGIEPDFNRFFPIKGRRVSLPLYPFERKRYWAEAEAFRNEEGVIAPQGQELTEQKASANQRAVPCEPDQLTRELFAILTETSGQDLSEAEDTMTFFEMGLDSLLLTQIAFKLQERFGVKTTFRQLLGELATPHALARHIVRKQDTAKAEAEEADEPVSGAQPAPAIVQDTPSAGATPSTEAQREIWLATQWSPEVTLAYLESATVTLHGPADLEILEQCLQELVRRHDSLRAVFSDDSETLHIAPFSPIPVMRINAGTGEMVDEAIRKEMTTSMDLETGPLFRASIIDQGQGRYLLVLTAHHSVCDGWSLDVMIEEIAKSYSARVNGEDPSLFVLPHQFHPYALAQRQQQQSPRYRDDERYWLERYRTLPEPLPLPTDFARPRWRRYEAQGLQQEIGPQALCQARTFCAASRVSLFSLMLASLGVVLFRLTQESDLVIAIPAAGQASSNQPDLIGHCTNLLPIRCFLCPNQSFHSYLIELQEKVVQAYEHQNYTYGTLIRNLKVKRDPSRLPLLTIGFTHTKRLRERDYTFHGLRADYRFNQRSCEIFDIYINAVEFSDKIITSVHFQESLFTPKTIAVWTRDFIDGFSAAGQNADEPIGACMHHKECNRRLPGR